jgi:3-hydroxyacyl-[acyl-carrier-protein] dehydratase
MVRKETGNFRVGSNVVELLLPHRRPFLMVDSIDSFLREPEPFISARRYISANEEVFNGHFPNLHLWPGVYTIEGLGQCCNLLYVLLSLQRDWQKQGGDPEDVLLALRNVELGFKLQPGYKEDIARKIIEPLENQVKLGMSSALEIKFLQPVFGGQRLDYLVTLTHELENMVRFNVEAQVEEKTVARGVMTATHGFSMPVPDK